MAGDSRLTITIFRESPHRFFLRVQEIQARFQCEKFNRCVQKVDGGLCNNFSRYLKYIKHHPKLGIIHPSLAIVELRGIVTEMTVGAGKNKIKKANMLWLAKMVGLAAICRSL
jgi:hypothetical protein